jgi:hypothetical protein
MKTLLDRFLHWWNSQLTQSSVQQSDLRLRKQVENAESRTRLVEMRVQVLSRRRSTLSPEDVRERRSHL